ncbi:unnamed protein product [Cuscuta campestris]|uniref:Integrase catalytic domain-containing protein n=1 Tax=Cuscuta campestris TaxID=132261 RepID=A0A484LWE4_9ASTE|nr:unnamed protein product [Cuscuta campestris]
MVQTRSNANVGTGAPQQGENSTTGGRNPPITTGEAEALIQRVGITAEQFKEVMAALAPNREVVVEEVAGGPTGGKAGPAGSQGKKKKVRRSQKKKATKPNGKAVMADALSRLDEEDGSSSFERMSAFDCLGDPKSKKLRTSAFERLQDTRSARKGDLRDTLKEKRGESTATSKVSSEERRTTDKGAAELWKMYEQLEKRLDAQNPYRQTVFSEVTPFSRRIMSCPLPDNFKTPQIKAYNGTTDPQDHLARFGANVVMYAYPEEIKCRCFLATLEGQACEWFHKLPKGSIDKWSNLAHKFLEHFASSRRQKLPFSHLLNVKIRKGEQLREFINRWEKEADDQALIAMLQAALPQGDVRKELRRNPLSTYQEMLARAKYLALEEEDDEPPVRKEKKSGPPVAEGKKRKDYGKGPNPTGYHANRHPVHAHPHYVGVRYVEEGDGSADCKGPPPRADRPPSSNRTWRRPSAPAAAITAGEGQEDGRRHLGRDCEDLDEEERQGRRHLGCRFIMGGNTGGDSVSSRKKWKNMVYLAEVQRPPLPKRKKKEPLVFTDEDYPPVLSPHRDALVIKVEINNVVVHRTLVDTGSSVNVMYSNTFKELGLSRSDLKPIHTPLSGFTGDTIEAEGTITVKAGVGDGTHRLWVDMEFMVVQLDCAHHLILGRPGLEDLECVISPAHLCLKFNTPTGVGVAKGNQSLSRSCYVRVTKSQARVDENVSTICAAIQKEEGRPRAEPAEEVEEVSLDPVDPERKVKVGKTLPLELKEQLLEVLRAFKVLFAWGPEDMSGVDPKIICHRLAVDPTYKPVKQKKRFRTERICHQAEQVPREENAEADILSKLGPDSPDHIRAMTQEEELLEPSISPGQVLIVTLGEEPDWIDEITMYILDGSLPADPIAAKVVKRRAPSYTLECGRLYKRSYNGTLLRCLRASEAQKLMEEIHEGICSAHQGAITMSRKVTLQGYFWPTIIRDCAEYVRKCKVFQEFQRVPGRPATHYTPISTAIPFARWGIDLVGILPRGTGNNTYLVVAIDYFTKWVEATPQIITDNGTQFEAGGFNEFLQSWGIGHSYAAVGYPQTNGQVENTNRTIMDGLKKKIMECKSAWVEELPYILWTYRTTPRKATGETPFSLTYGFEARAPAETSLLSYRVETYAAVGYPQTNGQVENTNRTIMDGLKKKIMECKSAWVEELPYILWTYRTTPRKATGETPFSLTYGFEARAPVETSLLSYKVEMFDAQENEENLRAELHLVDERRERAYMRAENYRRQVKSYHDQRVRPRKFQVGD